MSRAEALRVLLDKIDPNWREVKTPPRRKPCPATGTNHQIESLYDGVWEAVYGTNTETMREAQDWLKFLGLENSPNWRIRPGFN